jgi:hypothetical protein
VWSETRPAGTDLRGASPSLKRTDNGTHIPQALLVPATMAASPYAFDGPDADVILRAPLEPESDEFRDFHVYKNILSIASSVFRDILSISPPLRHTSGGITLDVIEVAEPARVIEPFLQLIYPVDPPVIEDLRLLDDLFQLAVKYAAKGVSAKLKKLLISPSFLKDDPIGVFVIACRGNLKEEQRLAVSHTFSIDVVSEISEEHLQSMTAKTYHRLVAKHAFRRKQLIRAVDAVQHTRGMWCSCLKKLKQEIRIITSGSPFLDREILDTCYSSMKILSYRCRPSSGNCIYEDDEGTALLSGIMRTIKAIPM